jgi:hypothetical protein
MRGEWPASDNAGPLSQFTADLLPQFANDDSRQHPEDERSLERSGCEPKAKWRVAAVSRGAICNVAYAAEITATGWERRASRIAMKNGGETRPRS